MLINTVILMLRDALPIALLISFMLLAFRVEHRSIWQLSLASLITTALLVFSRNTVSDLFDGTGYEWLTVMLLVVAYVSALASMKSPVQSRYLILTAVPIISLHVADFALYLVAFGSHSERIPAIFIGSVLGSGISLSIAILLVVLLAPYRTGVAMRCLWMLFMAAQACDVIPQLQQIGVLDETSPLWNSSALISDASEYGHLLNALMGYESQPGIAYFASWVGLVVVAQWFALRSYFLLRPRAAEGVFS
ncbi:hypothetical protein [Alteromonas sp. AMM-1]|uniref:hypothetical protein n=1 Tax=Alteromonas sp. AMM-1 TaxID=3394233 RepID=UPI0039A5C1AB